ESRLGGYFNPAAFSLAPQFTYGNLSRTLRVRGPGIATYDFSIFKAFIIAERFKGKFRAEAYNVTITPQFHNPSLTLGNAGFGTISSLWNFARVMQMGGDLTF